MMLSTKRPCAPCSGTGKHNFGMRCMYCVGSGVVDLKETNTHIQTFMVRKYMTWPVVWRAKASRPVIQARPNQLTLEEAFTQVFFRYENALATLATLE